LIDRNLHHIQTTLTESAQTLREHYPTLEDLAKAELAFIYNLVNPRIEQLEPKAKEIINFARQYLDPDRLFK
jgi:endonuclease III